MQSDTETRQQREVLIQVLEQAPVSVAELEARAGDPAAVEAAVEALVADDLLARDGERLVPTPVAARYHELARSAG